MNTGTVSSGDTIPPSVPTNVSGTAASSSVQISWTASADKVSVFLYRIYRDGVHIISVPSSVLSYRNTDLSSNTNYSFTVVAQDASNNLSAQSTPVSVTTLSDSSLGGTNGSTQSSLSPIGYWKFDGNGNNEIVGVPSAIRIGNVTFYSSGGKFNGYAYIPSANDWIRIPYNSIFDLPDFFYD